MSFFMGFNRENRIDKQIKNVTLQVRISLTGMKNHRKRIFPSASHKVQGSLTVEAALVLPLFLFAMVTIMMPFSMMNKQRQVQAVIESVCEDLSRLAYAGYELEQHKTEIKLPQEGLGINFGEGALKSGAMAAYAEVQVRRKLDMTGIRRLSLAKSGFMEDGEMVNLIAGYELMLPFPVFGLTSIPMVSSGCRRAWIGKDGGWLAGDSAGEEDEETVYVGKGSTRYHESRTCHYLYNQLTGVPIGEIDGKRNADGKRYYPCSACGGGTGGTVFIMPSGTSYHSSSSCTAIIAYVKMVKKSEVAHLGACSYCSGG